MLEIMEVNTPDEKIDTEENISGPLTVELCANNDDKYFCSFYYKAIKRLLDIDDRRNVSYLYRYLKIFCEYYDLWGREKRNLEDRDKTIVKLLKHSLYYRLAYVYRNAPLLSSAVAFHFRNVYDQSPINIERLISKKLVKICSLGGCSASDIVAIVTVLESIALKNGVELDFRVTIIESDEQWKITCITILSCLEQFHQATWKITFIRENLNKKKSWKSEVIKAIQEANVVTIIRQLFNFKNKEKILKRICDKLQPRAVLFLLDLPLEHFIELTFGINDSDDFELIHEESCDLHTLDIEAVNHSKKLYGKNFGNKHFSVNTSFNVFISVWIKTSPELASKCQDNKESVLQKNVENYNPKQSFFNPTAFTRWESSFTEKKENAGWTAKGIKKCVQMEKVKRNRLLVEFIDQKKKMDGLQKNILNKVQSFKEEESESNETDEVTLESYLAQKRQYALIKKTAYYSLLRQNK